MAFATPPWLEALLAIGGAVTNQQNTDLARAEDEKKFAEGKAVLGGALSDLPSASQANSFLLNALGRSEALPGQLSNMFGQLTANVGGDLRSLRDRSLQRVEKIGQQQLRDTGAQFESDRRASLGLFNRQGFASTGRASVSRGFTRGKTQALSRVREGILGRQLSTDIGTTGLLTGALERLGTSGIGAFGNAQTNAANLGFNAFSNVSGQRGNIQMQLANAILNRNEIPRANLPSDFFSYSQILKPAPEPEEPGFDWFGAAVQGAGAVAPFVSDRNLKQDIQDVNHDETLAKLERLDVSRWKYRADVSGPEGEHIGPMAQDFKELFGLGDTDTTINMVDAFGVALSALKALSQKVRKLEEQLDAVAGQAAAA